MEVGGIDDWAAVHLAARDWGTVAGRGGWSGSPRRSAAGRAAAGAVASAA